MLLTAPSQFGFILKTDCRKKALCHARHRLSLRRLRRLLASGKRRDLRHAPIFRKIRYAFVPDAGGRRQSEIQNDVESNAGQTGGKSHPFENRAGPNFRKNAKSDFVSVFSHFPYSFRKASGSGIRKDRLFRCRNAVNLPQFAYEHGLQESGSRLLFSGFQ